MFLERIESKYVHEGGAFQCWKGLNFSQALPTKFKRIHDMVFLIYTISNIKKIQSNHEV